MYKMKWLPKDLDMFLSSKEYVDTALVPLTPLSFGTGIKQSASSMEFMTILTNEMERQFKGRILLLPAFTYLTDWDLSLKKELVQDFKKRLLDEGVRHVFFLTSDAEWKSLEKELEDSLMWTPSIPLEHMDDSYKKTVIEDQVKQIMAIFIQKWRGSIDKE